MNEQSAIELLKIATDLSVSYIAKGSSVMAQGQFKPDAKPALAITFVDVFHESVKAVHDQYQQLTQQVGVEPTDK